MSQEKPVFKPQPEYRSRAYSEYLSKLRVNAHRQMALDLLRDKYQLNLHEVVGCNPEVVRARQEQYDEHLERLKEIWAAEDALYGEAE